MSTLPHIAITAGEPAGIGLDLCAALAHHPLAAKISIITDKTALQERASKLGLDIEISEDSLSTHDGKGSINVIHTPTAKPVHTGKLDAANAQFVLETLTTAIIGCLNGKFDAMCTAPVHKGIINDANIPFTGHTEFLAEQTNTPQVVMMLVGGGMRVALATTHLPVSQVSSAITQQSLERTLRILHTDLIDKFNIPSPQILVAGLNPHAGEGGYLGREEIDVIEPVLEKLRQEGMSLKGPMPADTLFTPRHLDNADAVLAMYHDQGLPVLKHASFGEGVNITLGLPIIRTSVDHGTALDLAGTGKAELGSLLAAINLAIQLANNQKKRL